MSKFLKIFAPSAGGAAIVLAAAYILADQFVVEVPAPFRGHVVRSAVAEATPVVEPAPDAEPAAEETAKLADAGTAQVAESASGLTAAGHGDAMPAHVKLALGRPATEDEIAAWDIDVRPDGQGLPDGSGDVFTGEEVFTERCAVCHGDFGEAVGRWPQLAGGQGTLTRDRPVKTIGSYWPYLSTVWDYVHRAMPFGDAQSLSDDEVYAIVAYLLYLNDIVDDEFELSRENFLTVEMPNAANFFDDDRETTEYPRFAGEVCMENCKDDVKISMRAAVLDVTPEETRARQLRNAVVAAKTGQAPAKSAVASEDGSVVETATAEEAPPEPAANAELGSDEAAPEETAAADPAAAPDPALVASGEQVFKKCKACHEIGEGAKNRSGPALTGVVGRTVGTADGFKYSGAMTEAGAGGLVWNDETLAEFLTKPKAFMNGTKMSFSGFKSEDDLSAIIAYLQSFSP